MKQSASIIILSLFLFLNFQFAKAQTERKIAESSSYIPLNRDYYHLIDRYEIKRTKFSDNFFSSVKAYKRKSVVAFADSVLLQNENLSEVDKFNLNYFKNDSWEFAQSSDNESEKPFLKHFYKKKSDYYYTDQNDFDVHINPVLYLSGSKDNQSDDSQPFINTRGVEIRGTIDKKVSFYSFMSENQIRFPKYVQDEIGTQGAIPGEGFWKAEDKNVADFFTARGYINFHLTKHIDTQIGYDKNFIGNGYRSLILSDFSNSYFFAKISTKVWRLNYTNIFAQAIASNKQVNNIYPKKYFTFHHLSINVTDNFNIGLFESITFTRADSLGGNNFDASYLNPIIFYRSIEHDLGDPDNAILGMDFKWNFLNRFQLYGQLVFDELIISEVTSGKGWWGNKQSAQLGMKYIDVAGVSNLDFQGELNFVRPYMYSHYDNVQGSNYQHYGQALAHPLGANFNEIIAIVRYQPIAKLQLTTKLIYAKKGFDGADENWGGNIFLDYQSRQQEYDNKIGQGIATNITYFSFAASYQLKHNFFIDFKQVIRNYDSEIGELSNKTSLTTFAIRWNIARRLAEF